jgi:L-fuconolactonase
MPSVDAHVHLWDLQTDPQPWIDPTTMAVIDRSFAPSELNLMLDACNADAAVVVQASNSAEETGRLMALSDPRIAGVVGWADMTADLEPQLSALLRGDGNLVGLRHLVHVEPDQNWLLRPEVGRSFDILADAGLPFDLVLRPWQLPLAAEVASRHPRTRFVLDHFGGLAESIDDSTWASDLATIAELPNVSAKISGLAGSAAYGERVTWAIQVALGAFRPGRLMYGSDWPLAELGVGAPAWRDTVLAALAHRSSSDQEQIFSGTASVVYRLDK